MNICNGPTAFITDSRTLRSRPRLSCSTVHLAKTHDEKVDLVACKGIKETAAPTLAGVYSVTEEKEGAEKKEKICKFA